MERIAEVIRMCIGCRKRVATAKLLRVVARQSMESGQLLYLLVPDPKRRLSGRGSHICRNSHCFKQAVSKRAFNRALRTGGQVNVSEVRTYIESEYPDGTPVHEAGNRNADHIMNANKP